MAAVMENIKIIFANLNGKWNEKKGLWEFSTVIAERKAFLSKKKLTYSVKLRVDDAAKVVRFSEMLMETGSGFSSGGLDDGISSGFGVKTESYNTFKSAPQITIEEQSKQFGKDFTYSFNFQETREKVRVLVEGAGYKFEYQILPVK
jgi:hypothetical protein